MSPQGIQTSLHLVRWKMSLHLSQFTEIRPSFEWGHLGVHSIWGRKHRVPLTYLLVTEGSSWGACGKLAYLFSRRQGMVLTLRRHGLQKNFLKLLYWNWWYSILETGVSVNLWSFLKGVKPLVLNDVDRWIFMEPMQGKLASSQFDLWYTKLFCVPEVTSVFFSSWNSVLGYCLEFKQANRGLLRVWLGKRNCSACNAVEMGLILQRARRLGGFLDLQQEPWVYSPTTAGMSIQNSSFFSEVRSPV